ncbi:MAG: hypothetical protein ACKPCJ_13485 [Betaproteobacteria bacterium]
MTDSPVMSRRAALALGAAATAATVAPDLLGAATPWPSIRPTRRHPSGPRLVVIGAGAFGGWTALALQRAGAQVTSDMGTDFLMRMGELASAAMSRLLSAPAA